MHGRGYTAEQLAWIPLTARAHALMNPGAYMHDTPMTMDDYFASRFIAEPVRLFDCDYPVNRAVAYIMTSEARAKDLKHPPVYLKGWAGADNAQTRGVPFDPWQGMSPTAKILYE